MNLTVASETIVSSRLPKVVFWLLAAAIAFPIRIDYPLGPFGTISAIDVGLPIVTAFLLARFLCLSPLFLGPRLLITVVLTPAFVAMFSIAWAVDTSLSIASAIKYCYVALIYFVALQLGHGLSITELARSIAVILAAWLAGSIAMYLGVPGFSYFVAEGTAYSQGEMYDVLASVYTRLGHPYVGQSNDYGPLLAFVGFILLGIGRAQRSPLFVIFGIIAFLACLLTFSRGLGVGLFVGLLVYAAIARISLWRLVLPATLVTVLLVAVSSEIGDLLVTLEDRELNLSEIVADRFSEANIQSRLEGYQRTLQVIDERTLLGYGVGYFDKSEPSTLVAAHSSLLEQWKYFGLILGTLTFFCYVAVIWYFWRLKRNAPSQSFLTDAIACAWVCLLIASLTQTFFEAIVPRTIIYFLLGLCVSTTVATSRPRAPSFEKSASSTA